MRLAAFTGIALSLAFLLPALACGDAGDSRVAVPSTAPIDAPPFAPPSVPPPSQAAMITLQPSNPAFRVGGSSIIRSTVTSSPGDPVWTGTVAWASSDSTIGEVRSLSPTAATVVGLRPGTVAITGTADGRTATTTLIVLAEAVDGQDVPMVVEDFHVVEFQYPSEPGRWYYAPQIRLRNTTGVAAAVVRLEFEIPGFARLLPCTEVRPVTSSPFDVLRELYGDYELSFDSGTRASTGVATVILTMRIGEEAVLLLRTGPVVPGSLPTTFTGGSGFGC